MPARVVRSLVFPVKKTPPPLRWLLTEFRLLVNRSIRFALRESLHSCGRPTKVACRPLSAEVA